MFSMNAHKIMNKILDGGTIQPYLAFAIMIIKFITKILNMLYAEKKSEVHLWILLFSRGL